MRDPNPHDKCDCGNLRANHGTTTNIAHRPCRLCQASKALGCCDQFTLAFYETPNGGYAHRDLPIDEWARLVGYPPDELPAGSLDNHVRIA